MQVQALTARIAAARDNLQKVELSPTKAAAMRELAHDEAILKAARGDSVEEMERLGQRAERIESLARGGGIAAGLALGGVVAWNVATQGSGIAMTLASLSTGLIPGLVLARFAHDGARSYTARHVQTPGVVEVVRRWRDQPAAAPTPAAQPGAENELTRLLDQIQSQVGALPDGQEKSAALESLQLDRNLAGQARGGTLEEMRLGCQKAARCEENGRRLGLGLGLAFTGALAAVMLTDPTVGLPLAVVGTVSGGFLSTIVLGSVLKEAGRDVGARFQRRGVEDLLERWSPLLQDRREQASAIQDEARRLSQAGPTSAVQVENGGVRVGGVFIRGRRQD